MAMLTNTKNKYNFEMTCTWKIPVPRDATGLNPAAKNLILKSVAAHLRSEFESNGLERGGNYMEDPVKNQGVLSILHNARSIRKR